MYRADIVKVGCDPSYEIVFVIKALREGSVRQGILIGVFAAD